MWGTKALGKGLELIQASYVLHEGKQIMQWSYYMWGQKIISPCHLHSEG